MECAIEGCAKPPRRGRPGWCEAHYTRWYRYGDPLGAGNPVKVIRWVPCPACGTFFTPRHNRGRLVRHCSRACAQASGVWAGQRNPAWKATVNYSRAHDRVRELRGSPSECEHCGATGRRMQWALDHGRCAEPLQALEGPYSLNPADYVRLCIPCHKRMDLSRLDRRRSPAAA